MRIKIPRVIAAFGCIFPIIEFFDKLLYSSPAIKQDERQGASLTLLLPPHVAASVMRLVKVCFLLLLFIHVVNNHYHPIQMADSTQLIFE